MLHTVLSFLSVYFDGIATLLTGGVAIGVFYWQKREKRMQAARILLLEIRNAEKTISEIKNSQAVTESSFILPVNSWQKLQNLFITDFDNDELATLNDFYNLCSLAQKEVDRINSFLPMAIEEKIRLTQQKLLELAEKHKTEGNTFGKGSNYLKEKEEILNAIFYNEADWFSPKMPASKLVSYLQNIRYITTSSCGQKLKKIARIS